MQEPILQKINKIGELKFPLKWIISLIIIILIILYFCNQIELFEKLLLLLVPFLIGTSVKVGYLALGGLV
jgi:hypothetical protein